MLTADIHFPIHFPGSRCGMKFECRWGIEGPVVMGTYSVRNIPTTILTLQPYCTEPNS